jgi:hypothetical protein
MHVVRPGGHVRPVSDIRTRLRDLGLIRRDDGTVAGELSWQARVEGDAARVAVFREQALGLMAFHAFAFMKPKSPAIHIAHSMGKYFGLSGLSPELQDRQVAFIEDRGGGRTPFPVLLSPNNSWVWVKTRAFMNTAAFGTFYEDEGNANKLWTTGVDDALLTDVCIPCLLALPHFLVDY